MQGWMVSMTKTYQGIHMEVIQEMQLKGIQVTHGMSQKFKFEIQQNLVHTLAWCWGSGLD